eukprot:COSAG01_NODE_15412_length_1339_cov_165.281225_1_plen_214_part_10
MSNHHHHTPPSPRSNHQVSCAKVLDVATKPHTDSQQFSHSRLSDLNYRVLMHRRIKKPGFGVGLSLGHGLGSYRALVQGKFPDVNQNSDSKGSQSGDCSESTQFHEISEICKTGIRQLLGWDRHTTIRFGPKLLLKCDRRQTGPKISNNWSRGRYKSSFSLNHYVQSIGLRMHGCEAGNPIPPSRSRAPHTHPYFAYLQYTKFPRGTVEGVPGG